MNKTCNYFLWCNLLHLNLQKTLLLMEDGNKKTIIFYSCVYPFWYHATFSKFTSTFYLFKLALCINNGVRFWFEFGILYRVEIHYKGPISLVDLNKTTLAMCPFHVNVTICQNFNLSHIYHISFGYIYENSSHGSNYVESHGSIYPSLS